MKAKLSRPFSILCLVLLLSSFVAIAFAVNPASAAAFSVAITSPASGATFNRGDSVTVTAVVTLSGAPVSGASVFAKAPTGESFSLPETSTVGTYSAQYSILGTDPTGGWTIAIKAVKNGQTTTASVTVSIVSGTLKVSIVSPVAGAKINIGETVTVKSVITHQDNTAVPTASVSFNKPISGSTTMIVDTTDVSGKTWTGSYTIQASDVTADGVAWPIVVTAISGGDAGSSTQTVNLYKSLTVSVSTFNSSTFSAPDDNFVKGETVFVKALATLLDGTPVISGTVSFVVTGTSIAATPRALTFNPSLHAWTGSYTLLSSDQAGSQAVTASATDSQGNSGSGTHQITVSDAQFLAITITSPSPNSVSNRGQMVTISASVKLNGNPATAATVTANNPTGGTITLTNNGGGLYSAQYTVLNTDPTGAWIITVKAIQSGQTAFSEVRVTISSSGSLKVSITTPSQGAKFNIGETATVKATVTNEDGSAVPSTASVSFNRPVSGAVSMTVDPSDPSGKTWKGTDSIAASDVSVDGATWSIVVGATSSANAGSSTPANVQLFSSLHIVVTTWSSASLTTSRDAFKAGDTVFVKAVVTLQDGTTVSAGTVNVRITGTSTANSPLAMTFSGVSNAWTASYTLLHTDQTGNQVVTVAATDTHTNTGSGTHTIGVGGVPTTSQPLEASVTFDPTTQDLVVRAVCNAGCVGPTTVAVATTTSTSQDNQNGNHEHEGEEEDGNGAVRTYTITDSAGHSLILKIQVSSDDHEVKAQILSLQYGNASPTKVSDNEIAFDVKSKHGGVKTIEQTIDTHDTQVSAHFDAKKDQTTISIQAQNSDDDDENEATTFTKTGLWLLELVTTNGAMNVDYFQAS